MMKKYFLTALPLLLLLSTCGYNSPQQSSGTGSIVFNIEWVGGPAGASRAAGIYRAPLDCDAAGVATIEAQVYIIRNGQRTVLATGGPWPCNAHSGDVSVPTPYDNGSVGILARNANGGIEYYGEQTGGVNVNPGQITDIGTVTASYIVPEGVTALGGSGANLISWSTVTGAFAYTIYYSTTPGVTPNPATKIEGVTSPYTHAGINNGTTYYYIITAIQSGHESAGSNEVSATPQAGATMPVTGDATSVTETSATLNGSFTNPSGYSTDAWFEWGTTTAYGNSTTINNYVQTGPVNNITANLTLQQNTTYHYRLVTRNTGGTFFGIDRTLTTRRAITAVANTNLYPRVLAVDSTTVYWTEHNNSPGFPGTGFINMAPKSGGTVSTLFTNTTTTTTTMPFGIAVDDSNVYWTDTAAGTVNKVPKGGGPAINIAANLNNPQFIVVDAASVYWTESGGGTVKKADINTGATTTLASGLNNPMGIAVDSTSVYWTEPDGGAVKKTGINGGAVTILASGLSHPWSIAVDSTSVYWTENATGFSGTSTTLAGSTGSIKKTGINGGVVTTLATFGPATFNQENPQGIAVDANSVYWASFCRISKVGINGGTVTLVAASTTSAKTCGLYTAVDSTQIYWTSFTGNTFDRGIYRSDK